MSRRALGFSTPEDQFQQLVVREVQKHIEPGDFFLAERGFVRSEEALQHEIVFEQSAARPPAQPATSIGVDRGGGRLGAHFG